jgi:hypothetical protein
MFWFKRKEIVVDCFTFATTAALNFPIDRATKFYPSEFKSIPRYNDVKVSNHPESKLTVKSLTVKACNGILDLYSSGFIIPAWDEFHLEMLNNGDHVFHSRSNIFTTEKHPREQYGNEIYKGYSNLKITSPWLIKEKTGVKFSWNHPVWNRSDNVGNFTILPGIIDFKYQIQTNINTFMKNGTIVQYNAGDPLVHLIPLSDKKVKIKIHQLSYNKWESSRDESSKFALYDNHRKLKYPQFIKEIKRCPFRV